MPLTPIDVQQKTFGTALRGYDLDEVDDFLDEVVTALKDYEQRLRDAQERISTLEMEVTDRGDAEGAIARALVAAQRSADAIVDDARAEAERILAEARVEASEIDRARDQERSSASAEIERIRSLVADLRTRVHGLAGAVGASLAEADSAVEGADRALHASDGGLEVADEAATQVTDDGGYSEDARDTVVSGRAYPGPGESMEPDEADEEGAGDAPDESDDVVPDWRTPVRDEADPFASGSEAEDTGTDEDEQGQERAARPWEIG